MRAVAAYMASRNNESRPHERENGRTDNNWPEPIEMRRRRDSKGRYMEHDDGMDARAYDARAEYNPQGNEYGRMTHMTYRPDYPIAPMNPRGGLYDGGGIGFGTRDREYQTRSHYDDKAEKRQSANVGGMLWMEPNREEDEDEEESSMMLDRETAERWAHSMRNEDNARPSGARWSMEELKNMAQKFGIKPDTDEFAEFWVMTNAMYSDYCGVAKKFNITSPEFYGMMALAWMRDKDAKPNKTALYYKYIVKK